jgi:hypothetical protein
MLSDKRRVRGMSFSSFRAVHISGARTAHAKPKMGTFQRDRHAIPALELQTAIIRCMMLYRLIQS